MTVLRARILLTLQPSDVAWIVLAAGVVVYNLLARDGQQMSEGADRYILAHPWLTRAVAAAVALHVTNAIPDRFDIIHYFFKARHR